MATEGNDCLFIERCPIETTLGVIGGKWKPMILFYLRAGPQRFSALRRLMPTVTQRMLTAHLRELEADGVIKRRVFPQVPPKVEYSMTPMGYSLTPILAAMAEWGACYENAQNAKPPAAGPEGECRGDGPTPAAAARGA